MGCGGVAVGCGVADGVGVGGLVDIGDGLGVDMLVGDALAVVMTSGGTIAGLVVRRDQAHAPPAPPPISSTTPAMIAQRCQPGFDVAA